MSPCQKSPARFVQLLSIDLRLVLDRQTDRQTQTDTGRHRAVASTRSSIASRGKKLHEMQIAIISQMLVKFM